MDSKATPCPSATLITARLRLVPCGMELLDLLVAGPDVFRTATGIELADGYLEFPEGLEFCRQQLRAAESSHIDWWTPRLFVLADFGTAIGFGGFKGPPGEDGFVEFGYGTAFAWRLQGYATEAARALADYALRQPGIRGVRAHTLPETNASTQVLAKCGLQKVAEIVDPTDGPIWRWEHATPASSNSTPSP